MVVDPGHAALSSEDSSRRVSPTDPRDVRARGLLEVAADEFVACELLLTPTRLEFYAESPESGYGCVGSYPRSECEIAGAKHISQGDLFVIRHPQGVACLYFAGDQRSAAGRIRAALRGEAQADPVLLAQEFANLIADPEEQEEEDY